MTSPNAMILNTAPRFILVQLAELANALTAELRRPAEYAIRYGAR